MMEENKRTSMDNQQQQQQQQKQQQDNNGVSNATTSMRKEELMLSVYFEDDDDLDDDDLSKTNDEDGSSENHHKFSSTSKTIVCREDGSYDMTGFFSNDLSGHANILVPLKLSCPSYDYIKQNLLDTGAIATPTNTNSDRNENPDTTRTKKEDDNNDVVGKNAVSFELQCQACYPNRNGNRNPYYTVIVEQVSVLDDTFWIPNDSSSIGLNVQVVVRAKQEEAEQKQQPEEDHQDFVISSDIQFAATLTRPVLSSEQTTSKAEEEDDDELGLLALQLGRSSFWNHPSTLPSSSRSSKTVMSEWRRMKLTLVPAVTLDICEIGAPRAASGATLVNIIIQHSNYHSLPVTITNLALHPGHVRYPSFHPAIPTMHRSASAGDAGGDDSSVMTYPSQMFHNNNNNNNNAPSNSNNHTNDHHLTPTLNHNATNTHVRSSSAFPHFPARPSAQQQQQQAAMPNHHHHNKSSPWLDENTAMAGGETSVLDMSRNVRWAYAPGTAPSFPLVLQPQDAIATVLQIDAIGNDWQSNRTFVAPLALTAIVQPKKELIISADVHFTTAPSMSMEDTIDDAFRVDMAIQQDSTCVQVVGAPVIVSLKVTNLSNDTKDLMLLMAKDEDRTTSNKMQQPQPPQQLKKQNTYNKRISYPNPHQHLDPHHHRHHHRSASFPSSLPSTKPSSQHHQSQQPQQPQQPQPQQTVHTAVVSEVNGYTFGVWGLLAKNSALRDDGTLRYHRDHELLAVDAALLLGEVKAHQTMDAELRFVPLREGTLDIPNLKLYDKIAGRWYSCVHMLKIVAAAATSTTTPPTTETSTTTHSEK